MGMARYAARCPSRVTRRVGYLLCLSILLLWKTENPEDFDFIAGPRFDYTEIDTLGRNFDEERGGGFLFRPVVDPMHVVSAVTIPPLPPPDRYRVRPWSRHRTLALPVCKARVIYSWKVAVSFFFPLPFLFLLVFSFFWTLTRAYIVVTPLRIFAPIYHN